MKKLVLFLAVAFSVSLFSCGGSDKKAEVDTVPAEATEVVAAEVTCDSVCCDSCGADSCCAEVAEAAVVE